MRCTARSKQSGERCGRHATPGHRVCASHGSKTPTGVDLPQTRHGRYSKDLPTGLRQRYHDALEDPELMALHDDIAMLSARQHEVLATTQAGTNAWSDLMAAASTYRTAARDRDKQAAASALRRIFAIVDERINDAEAWEQFERLATRKAALIAQEQKRLVVMGQMISARDALLLVEAVTESVRTHVTDPATLLRIRDDFRRILGTLDFDDPTDQDRITDDRTESERPR